MELPSLSSRLETVIKLWNKTQKYLVIVENGTNAGFKIINEIREFILNKSQDTNQGYVFSPVYNNHKYAQLAQIEASLDVFIFFITMQSISISR